MCQPTLSRSKSDVTGGVLGYLELRYHAWQVYLLVCSSVLLSIPSVLGARHGVPVLSVLCGGASVASVNYWRRPGPSWRRDLDFVFAIGAILWGIIGAFSLVGTFNYLTWLAFLSAVLCIIMSWSGSVGTGGDGSWARWHAGSHVSLAVAGSCIALGDASWPTDAAAVAHMPLNGVADASVCLIAFGVWHSVRASRRSSTKSE